MTIWKNNAEGGTDGTTATTTNTGAASGDVFASVTRNAGQLIFSAEKCHSGSLSYKITAATSGTNKDYVEWNITSTNMFSMRGYIYLTAYPTTGVQLFRFGSTTTAMGLLYTDNLGGFKVQANTVDMYSGATIPLNTWVRWELYTKIGSTTSNGQIYGAIFRGEDEDPIDSYENLALNTGVTWGNRASIGKWSNSGNWPSFYLDDVYADDSQIVKLGPMSGLQRGWDKVRL